MLHRLLSLLVPAICLVCRAPGADLCRDCRRELPWLLGRTCHRCGLPAPCGSRCPAEGAAFASAWAPHAYDGAARGLVLALKAGRVLAAADLMAAQIAATAPSGLLGAGSTLVPVPADPHRARTRGFDHGQCLARALGRRARLPVSVCLRRAAGSATQAGAGRSERLAAGRIAVAVRGRPPGRAVLVDDVHTTGATLHTCAAALRLSGTERVDAVTFARTIVHFP